MLGYWPQIPRYLISGLWLVIVRQIWEGMGFAVLDSFPEGNGLPAAESPGVQVQNEPQGSHSSVCFPSRFSDLSLSKCMSRHERF